MALASRPKPNIGDKKRQAQHHRQGKDYLKTYWPYLPMLVIVGVGAVINKALYSYNLGGPANVTEGSLGATRIGSLTDQASWGLVAVIAVTAVAAIIFAFTHWYRFHRMLNRGERFVIRHPWFDISLVLILTAGVILTRASV